MLRQLVLHSGAALTRSGAGASSLVPLAQRLRGACSVQPAASARLTRRVASSAPQV